MGKRKLYLHEYKLYKTRFCERKWRRASLNFVVFLALRRERERVVREIEVERNGVKVEEKTL